MCTAKLPVPSIYRASAERVVEIPSLSVLPKVVSKPASVLPVVNPRGWVVDAAEWSSAKNN